MDLFILKEIAQRDRDVWKLFSLLNKEMNRCFNVLSYEYEIAFREIKINEIATSYRLDGKLHRSDGPAIIYSNGTEEWRLNGEQHRLDGPAKIIIGYYNHWFKNGLSHRIGGPAIEFVRDDMKKYNQWYIDGKSVKKNDEKRERE